MTREQAQREAVKRWGKSADIRAHESISSPERRAVADGEYQKAKAELETIESEIRERLAACDWYQELTRKRTEARKRKEATVWARIYRKFAVGSSHGIGFHIEGEGDTWAEAFAAADRKKIA